METSLPEGGAFSAVTGGSDAVPSSGVIVNFPGFQPDQVNHKNIMQRLPVQLIAFVQADWSYTPVIAICSISSSIEMAHCLLVQPNLAFVPIPAEHCSSSRHSDRLNHIPLQVDEEEISGPCSETVSHLVHHDPGCRGGTSRPCETRL